MRINGNTPIFTLEETELQVPPGTYQVELTYSPKFHRLLPLLSVPHRKNIRIHQGNWPGDSSGCILVGLKRNADMLVSSQMALDALTLQIQKELDDGGVVQISIA